MNDYFHMLAETALGMRAALTPLVGPLFSPLHARPEDESSLFVAQPQPVAVRTETRIEAADRVQEVHHHHHAAAMPASATHPVIERREEVRQTRHETVRESTIHSTPAPPLAVPAPSPMAAPAAREIFSRLTERTIEHEPVRTVDRRTESHTIEREPGRETVREITQMQSALREQVRPSPAVERTRTVPQAPQFRPIERIAPPKEPEPVRIVIDRIEIRANSASPAAVQTQSPSPAPATALTLDEFMKRGRG